MITEPLLTDFSLNNNDGRVFFASLNFWATLIGASFCLPVGWALDRFDRRLVLLINMLLLGATVIWMSHISSWQWLAVALLLTRGLGQSALSIVSLTLVAKSFSVQRLSMAMAWYAILAVPFHLGLIKGVGWALSAQGMSWRIVWGGVGYSLFILSMTAFLLKRTQPTAHSADLQSGSGFTLKQALGSPAFWTIAITVSVWGMIYSGVALFNEDIFRERGFSRELYFSMLAEVTVIALLSKLAFGWLARRVRLTTLLGASLLITSASLAGLSVATLPWHAYAYGVGLGISSGAVALLFFTAWGQLFGQRELGRIQAAAQMLTVVASAMGPVIFAASKRSTDSYSLIFLLLAGIVFLMSCLALITPVPINPTQPSKLLSAS